MSKRADPIQTLTLYRDAPPRPAYGAACTGCGQCCAAEPCPIGQLLFRRRRGTCPALAWDGQRYVCGLVATPERHFGALPQRWQRLAARLAARWIAAGTGCDSAAEEL